MKHLSTDSEVNGKDSLGRTPLYRAAYNGHKKIVELLLNNKADVNIPDENGWSALHGASYKGHFEIVSVLISRKAHINSKDIDGDTPLDWAKGNKEIIKKMKTLQSQSTSCASSISQAAACVALSQECTEMPLMTKEYRKRHDYVVRELNTIDGVICKETDGTFYVFPSFQEYIKKSMTIKDDNELALHLLNNAKVAVVPGSAFGQKGHIRISIAIDMRSLKEAMQRIIRSL